MIIKKIKSILMLKKSKLHKSIWLTGAFLLLSFAFMLSIRLYVNNPITGDEPHYLLMDYSLQHDGDVNLKNNYLNGDSRDFYPGLSAEKQVGPGQYDQSVEKWYSIHGIGFPLVLLPSFLVAGKLGVIVFMVMLATLVIWLTKVWVHQVTGSKKIAFLSSACLLIAYSYSGLAGYIYPDMLIAALTLVGLILVNKYPKNQLAQITCGAIAGLLPLIHFKAVVISLPLLLVLVYKCWFQKKRSLPWATLASFLPLVAYFFYSNYSWFGVLNPARIYTHLDLPTAPIWAIISGFLFDSMRGLLIYNPVLILIFIGLPIWFKKDRENFLTSLFVILPSVAGLAVFGGWQGGDSQIGRYAIDFLPVLFPAIGLALIHLKKHYQVALVASAVLLTLLITVDSVIIRRTYVRRDQRSPLFAQLERHTGLAFDRLLPTFTEKNKLVGKKDGLKITAGFFGLFMLTYYGYRLSKLGGATTKESRKVSQ